MGIFYKRIGNSEQTSFTKKLKVLLDWLIIRQYELYRIDSLHDVIIVVKHSGDISHYVTLPIEMLMNKPSDYVFEMIEWEFSKLEGER